MRKNMKQKNTSHDVILYGASGFTGRQTARYFADNEETGSLRWAMAGRNQKKLEQVRKDLGAGFEEVPILVADSNDMDAVRSMVSQTRVVLNTAGPFALFGENIVSACIDYGVDYVDITGETVFVRYLIDRYHEKARRNTVRIIPFCGFDSVPADLGTLFLAKHVMRTFDQACREIKGFYSARGGVNGGTLASLYTLFDMNQYQQLRDPLILVPDGNGNSSQAVRQQDPVFPHYDADIGSWTAPFFMAPINTRVVRRSHALFSGWGEGYGQPFTYQEYTKVGGSMPWLKAFGISAGLATVTSLCRMSLARSLLKSLSPKPGSGPSKQAMDSGFFRLRLTGKTESGQKVLAIVEDVGDPGNRVTVKTLCESALSLALEKEKLPGGNSRGGILTPATGLGMVLVNRLSRMGMTFRFEDGADLTHHQR